MIPVTPLLAQGELIGILIMILVFVVPAILQALNKQAQRQKGPPGRRPPARPAVGKRPAAGDVEAEIEEFLRRAAQPRGVQPPRPAARPAMAQLAGGPRGPGEVARDRPVGVGMAEHVQKYLDRDEFQRRAAELGGQAARTDQQTERHLQQVFGHEVSHLADVPGESAAVPQVEEPGEADDRIREFPTTAAAGLAALFSDATSIRQAIIINEILQRPEHRWS